MTFGLGGLAALFITARGNRPCVVLNGTTMVEVEDERRIERPITLQRHAFSALKLALAAAALAVAACAQDTGGDGGPTALAVPAGTGSGQPHLAATPQGEAVLSWLEPNDQGHVLRFARLEENRWSAPETVASGPDFVANWADIPSVVPITDEVWIAHWLKMAPDSFASYDIAIALSRDAGRTWTDGTLLNDDGVLTEHGFVSFFPWDGDIGAVWLDGRRLAEEFEAGDADAGGAPIGMSLRYARIALDGAVLEQGEIDELACDCCRTDAVRTGGGPVVVYRDRTPDEIRDISVRRYGESGWLPPVTLGSDGWRIEGCPVNGPAIAADGHDVVAAWFTAPENRSRVQLARSGDGGASFGPAIEIDSDGAFGQVDVVLLGDGEAIVSWWRRGTAGIELAVRRVSPDGSLGEPRAVATSSIPQPLDVPQMIATRDMLVLAWTDAAAERIASASIEIR